jgi:hypothetical protein
MKICELCNKEFEAWINIDGKLRNLQRRKLCLDCSPFGSKNTKTAKSIQRAKQSIIESRICNTCGRLFKSNRRWRCSPCCVKIRRIKSKIKAVEMLGGQCERCGWHGNIAGYEFHHKENFKKEFGIGDRNNKSWGSIIDEIKKCELLCSICHRIEHTNRSNMLLLKVFNEYKDTYLKI